MVAHTHHAPLLSSIYRYKAVKNDLFNCTQLFFEGMDDLEKKYATEVAKQAHALVAEIAENPSIAEDLDEEVVRVIQDDSQLSSLLQDSNDKHVEKQGATNDALEDTVEGHVKKYLAEVDVELTVRHRGRVDEIQRLQADIVHEIATHTALVSEL